MYKCVMSLGLLAILPLFCFGCSWTTQGTSKDTMIRCPKCAAFYSSKEGAETFEWMRGEPENIRR